MPARLAPFRLPMRPPSSPPRNWNDAQRPPNLLCSMDNGTDHQEPRPRNSAAIKTIREPCQRRSAVIPGKSHSIPAKQTKNNNYQVNALLAIMPELDDGIKGNPMGSVNLGDSYVLLHKWDKRPWLPTGEEARVISEFMGQGQPLEHFKRWAWLRLPNGQIAQSLWWERLKATIQIHISRNVKASRYCFC